MSEGLFHRYRSRALRLDAEKQASVLNAELAHRIKNVFALVQAIEGQTFKESGGRDDVQSFEKRLLALSGANDVLVQAHASKGQLHALLESLAAGLSIEDAHPY